MKKLSLLILMAAITFAGCKKGDDPGTEPDAVNLEVTSVSKSNHSLVVKFSGTNCPPCGSWGWAMMSDLLFGVGDAGVCMVAYGQNFVAQNYICQEEIFS